VTSPILELEKLHCQSIPYSDEVEEKEGERVLNERERELTSQAGDSSTLLIEF